MDVETWRALEWLKAIVPAPLRRDPDLVWDVHAAALSAGRSGIGIYREGIGRKPADAGALAPTTHGYQLWFNDGVNQIRIDVSSMGAFPTTREDLRAAMAREALEEAARAVFEAFAKQF